MRRFILLSCFFLSFFLGCKDNISIEPPVEIPEEKDNKTYLEIKNQSQFDVNIYVMLPHSSESPDLPWLTVPKGETKKQEISPSKQNAGDYIYIEYEYVVENVVIHCYDYNSNDCNKQVPIYENKVNTIEISANPALNTDDSYVIIQNETSDEVFLFNEVTLNNNKSTTLICPINSKGNRWIDKYGVYKNLPTSGEIYLGNDFIKSNELNLGEIEPGNIYVYRYNDETVSLLSATPFNFSLQNKVWKNSLSKTYGKDLVAGCIAPRENKEDGYMLFGSLSASYINDNIEGNVPYYAFMNTNGEITKEYSLNFKDNPKNTLFYHCIEKNGIWLAVGKNRYEDNSDSLFIIGEGNGRTFYQKIPSPAKDSEQEQSDEISVTSNYKACGITYVEDKTFCVLLGYEDDKNGEKAGGFELLEITIDGLNEVKTSIVYKTSEDDKKNAEIPCSILYNKDKYIVLSQNSSLENSTISVIDKNTDILKCNNRTLNSCSLNKMKIYSIKSEEYFFLSGSYVDAMSGRDIATFGKIKIDDINNFSENSEIDTSNFKMFTGSNNSLNSNFDDFVVDKKGNIILGGFSCADYDYQHRTQSDVVTKNAVPFVVSYNLTQDKTNWEKEYTDQKGYVVYSVDKSSIDSLFLDLWNPSNRHSYIVSTGLLGEIPERTKLTFPHSSFVEEVEGAEITIKFYEKSNSQTVYKQDVFKLGKEYTLEDFKQYEPANMCKVVGWNVLDKDNSTVNRNLYVYKHFYLPVHPMGTPSVKDEDTSIEDDTVVEGEELVFPIKFTDYKITEINLYPKYEHNFSYDENYHWCICRESKSEHIFSDWQITVQPTESIEGERVKKCSVCEYIYSQTVPFTGTKQILFSTPNKKIIDNGEWGLGTDNSGKQDVLNLSPYKKYMNSDYEFKFDISIVYEAQRVSIDWYDGDGYEEGTKQVFLYKKNPGCMGDGIGLVNDRDIYDIYGLLCREEWDDDKGTKKFSWTVNGFDCNNNMYLKYDAYDDGNTEDTWYVKSITVDLSIELKS